MKALVTGASGFIGGAVVRTLVAAGIAALGAIVAFTLVRPHEDTRQPERTAPEPAA